MTTKNPRRNTPRKRTSSGTNSYPHDEAIKAHDEAIKAPDLVWQRLLDGETPLRVWREFRGLSRAALAEKLDVDHVLIFALEHESDPMSDEIRDRISVILGIPAQALVRMVDKRVS